MFRVNFANIVQANFYPLSVTGPRMPAAGVTAWLRHTLEALMRMSGIVPPWRQGAK